MRAQDRGGVPVNREQRSPAPAPDTSQVDALAEDVAGKVSCSVVAAALAALAGKTDAPSVEAVQALLDSNASAAAFAAVFA